MLRLLNGKCDDPLAPHRQKRYFEQLASVTQFTYFAGKLALTYQQSSYGCHDFFSGTN